MEINVDELSEDNINKQKNVINFAFRNIRYKRCDRKGNY